MNGAFHRRPVVNACVTDGYAEAGL